MEIVPLYAEIMNLEGRHISFVSVDIVHFALPYPDVVSLWSLACAKRKHGGEKQARASLNLLGQSESSL